MSYIAKRHVPATCAYCDKPCPPTQSRTTRCLAGSYVWNRGMHFSCLLHVTYGKDILQQVYDRDAFLFKIAAPKCYGRSYNIPIPIVHPQNQYRANYDRIFKK